MRTVETNNLKKLFATRFKSARLTSGFSLQDLADAMGNQLSRQALHRYDKGEVIPDSKTINLLAKALNISPSYFFRETKVKIEIPEYIEYHKLEHY
ncbi:MAG: helix-turn-helix domain-containing protein [Flavobacteriaceae bacterium]|jgi:transcriptional regulator with XRE-family HTH domain|nr:helix-turn-helix domain-containing protein [Flavobacteriaceae bacterium]